MSFQFLLTGNYPRGVFDNFFGSNGGTGGLSSGTVNLQNAQGLDPNTMDWLRQAHDSAGSSGANVQSNGETAEPAADGEVTSEVGAHDEAVSEGPEHEGGVHDEAHEPHEYEAHDDEHEVHDEHEPHEEADADEVGGEAGEEDIEIEADEEALEAAEAIEEGNPAATTTTIATVLATGKGLAENADNTEEDEIENDSPEKDRDNLSNRKGKSTLAKDTAGVITSKRKLSKEVEEQVGDGLRSNLEAEPRVDHPVDVDGGLVPRALIAGPLLNQMSGTVMSGTVTPAEGTTIKNPPIPKRKSSNSLDLLNRCRISAEAIRQTLEKTSAFKKMIDEVSEVDVNPIVAIGSDLKDTSDINGMLGITGYNSEYNSDGTSFGSTIDPGCMMSVNAGSTAGGTNQGGITLSKMGTLGTMGTTSNKTDNSKVDTITTDTQTDSSKPNLANSSGNPSTTLSTTLDGGTNGRTHHHSPSTTSSGQCSERSSEDENLDGLLGESSEEEAERNQHQDVGFAGETCNQLHAQQENNYTELPEWGLEPECEPEDETQIRNDFSNSSDTSMQRQANLLPLRLPAEQLSEGQLSELPHVYSSTGSSSPANATIASSLQFRRTPYLNTVENEFAASEDDGITAESGSEAEDNSGYGHIARGNKTSSKSNNSIPNITARSTAATSTAATLGGRPSLESSLGRSSLESSLGRSSLENSLGRSLESEISNRDFLTPDILGTPSLSSEAGEFCVTKPRRDLETSQYQFRTPQRKVYHPSPENRVYVHRK